MSSKGAIKTKTVSAFDIHKPGPRSSARDRHIASEVLSHGGLRPSSILERKKSVSSLDEQCSSFLTRTATDVVGSSMKGYSGGQWSSCTHLKVYGLNFAPFVARFLSYQLAPKTALEFGCGLGTTSDFVARFANATVTCVEPEKTLGELILSLRN